jgi:FAD/FMN-containing dehydrogenase
VSTRGALDLDALRSSVSGRVLGPSDPGWDEARVAWHLEVDQRPAAIVEARSGDDVSATVRAAVAAGLRVAPQATGHNAGPLAPNLPGAVLVRTGALRDVEVDADRRRARIGSGALSEHLASAAQGVGLSALSGSSPNVGVVGYALGGGLSLPFARAHGLQSSGIAAALVVTASGDLAMVDDERDPDLAWALRGGGGNVGVVVSLELELHPVRETHAGWLAWDWEASASVLERWVDWSEGAPEAVTTSFRILQLPPLEDLPEPVRGRRLAMIDGAVLGGRKETDAILRPLRELRPEIDTFAPATPVDLLRLHLDPEPAVPIVTDHRILAAVPADAQAAVLELAGPGSGSPLLVVELRQLGGALARPPARPAALETLDGAAAFLAIAVAPDAEAAEAARARANLLAGSLASWSTGRTYLNLTEEPADPATLFSPESYRRLREVRARADPGGVFLANHAVPHPNE